MSDETKHTPGPWFWSSNRGLRSSKPESLHGPRGEIVLSWGRESDGEARGLGFNTVLEVNKPNGDLIQAAPMLLESLKWFIHIIDNTEKIKELCFNDVGASILVDARRQAIGVIASIDGEQSERII